MPPGLILSGGLCLLPGEGLVRADLLCEEGKIARVASEGLSGRPALDATGCFVLPGIVDIHGDAFERQIMPRPGAAFPLEIALLDTDAQLAANGITTAYHGVTISWEPGLRSLAHAREIVAALDRLATGVRVDNRLHLRWETFALEAVESVATLLARKEPPLLAFNDHTSPFLDHAASGRSLRRHAERAGMAERDYAGLFDRVAARAAEVPAAVATLAAVARRHGAPLLSHDDRTPEARSAYRSLGVAIAEFPVTPETLACSAAAGDVVVLGAPNVVRGGSHTGAVGAEAAVRAGTCHVLASDYYYPAPLHAAFLLADRGALPFAQAWDLVSAAPARACGLEDRGRIAEGLRADLVVVPATGGRPVATIAAGRIAYRAS